MLKFRTFTFFRIAQLKASRNQDVYDTCKEKKTLYHFHYVPVVKTEGKLITNAQACKVNLHVELYELPAFKRTQAQVHVLEMWIPNNKNVNLELEKKTKNSNTMYCVVFPHPLLLTAKKQH